ncbi:hypothetical protein [Flavobacterium sp. LC2016-13]|nr:hypothetical protein [Flavobacterium sp. LC2016-13]
MTIHKLDFLNVFIDVFASNAALTDDAYNLIIPVSKSKIIMLKY